MVLKRRVHHANAWELSLLGLELFRTKNQQVELLSLQSSTCGRDSALVELVEGDQRSVQRNLPREYA